jgi:hypothetical protein
MFSKYTIRLVSPRLTNLGARTCFEIDKTVFNELIKTKDRARKTTKEKYQEVML